VIFVVLMRVLQQGEEEGEVRHMGFETGVTGEGSSPRCGHGGGSNFPWRKWLGRLEDGVEGLSGEVEGGWCTRGVKKACDGVKREEGVARLPFSGRRHARQERDGGSGRRVAT
jgi:hypothetical protein